MKIITLNAEFTELTNLDCLYTNYIYANEVKLYFGTIVDQINLCDSLEHSLLNKARNPAVNVNDILP